MDNKKITILGVITLLVVMIAVLIAQRRESATSDGAYGKAYFPGLDQRLNDVAAVEIVQGPTKITLQRDGEVWRVKEKGGYAADFDMLQPLVLSVANLQRVEAKTSKPEQYEKIGVSDPSAAEAEHPGITLKDGKNTVMAALVVGIARDSDDGTKKLLYVRTLDNPQAWLVEGSVAVITDAAAWIRKSKVLDIYRSRIKSISVALPEGDRYLLTRDTPDAKAFRYLPPPRNAKIRSFARIDDMTAALENVVPDDALVAGSFEFSGKSSAIIEYKTFDGLVIKAMMIKHDELWYVKYEVKQEAEMVAGVAPTGDVADKIKLEAETLARDLGQWIFLLPDTKAALMVRKSNDVLEPEKK